MRKQRHYCRMRGKLAILMKIQWHILINPIHNFLNFFFKHSLQKSIQQHILIKMRKLGHYCGTSGKRVILMEIQWHILINTIHISLFFFWTLLTKVNTAASTDLPHSFKTLEKIKSSLPKTLIVLIPTPACPLQKVNSIEKGEKK